ncbi:MAG TPA: crosslink repair DNA glycosylase YcaQ family protein [Bacteroidia bacterium]|nr:crosslink repair DNA glycosylase YcaQ family protein [Bacteroidia bacterium]
MKKKSNKHPLKISVAEAKKIAAVSQGLAGLFSKGKPQDRTLSIIRHLGYVQIDTLSMVARAHHHTLFTRSKDYKEHHLDALMNEKKIFEYWSHAAAYLPMEDFRFSLPRKHDFRKGKAHWFARDKKMHRYVRDKIKAEGPLQAKDFGAERKHGSWFDWKPAKIALEQLFQDGTLMIAGRKGFQKIYDLTERVLPAGVSDKLPSDEEYAEYLVRSALRAHGIASQKDMTHLRRGMQEHALKKLKQLLREKEILEISVEGVKENYFVLPGTVAGIATFPELTGTHLFSPFDNLIIRRERLKKIFNYDFQVEFYLPEHKRKFGYFCLPVLCGDEFIGRMDVKADRSLKTFFIRSFHVENPAAVNENTWSAFAAAVKSFAAFNACEKIKVEKVYPGKYRAELARALR